MDDHETPEPRATAPPKPSGDDDTPIPTPEQLEREQQVRQKMRQMYGDDSPETVRRFLWELAGGSEGDDGSVS